ncbi:thioredoxin fold domain-containing protein [Serratia ureilytica]|uniref:thioredoxin fold domain-containing protein n=1 Tax=Serratia ureilytica TaxID=300181 RepID=UPI001AA130EF|nr:thioredoxin fold domain-containing protein [Serratia ureilytica]MBO1811505.1 thioredoxin fold domain-containing protein [Serratia ureilytica]
MTTSLLTPAPRFSVRRRTHWLVLTESRGDQARVLAVLDLRKGPVFFLQDEHVICRDSDGIECNITPGDEEDAAALMAAIVQALPAQVTDTNSLPTAGWWRLRAVAGAFLVAGLAGNLIFMALNMASHRDTASTLREPRYGEFVYGDRPTVPGLPPAPVRDATALLPARETARPPAPVDPVPPSPDAPAPADGWSLPVAVRATLPGKLKSAADRELFTVNYSQGHARTLYVFADPHCPNCRRLEPALNAAARQANVVVFPVAVVGREASVSAVTPVLCLPPEKRKAAWDALFDVGHDARQMGDKPAAPTGQAADCDLAGKALGVNEVAYQTYRIPGTPWVIADDGRHVPQKVLRDPAALKAFLEVNDAAR